MAVQIIIQFSLTVLWSRAGDDLAGQLVRLHVSLGVCLVATLLFRILWRLVWGRRLPTTLPRLQAKAAHAVHSLLYLMMNIEVASGLSKRWVRARSVDVFGLIHIPSPFVFAPDLRPIISVTHEYLAWAIIIVACGHGLVALGHRVWLRDGVLERMTG